MGRIKRKTINRTVKPATVRLLQSLSKSLDIDQGRVIDRAVESLAVVESFGAGALKLRGVVGDGDGSALILESLGTSPTYTSDTPVVSGTVKFGRGKKPEVSWQRGPRVKGDRTR